METDMHRLVSALLACLVVCGNFPYTAQDGYCFRYRDPNGVKGKCRELIENMPGLDGAAVGSPEDCCRVGGEGWSEKTNGKKCANTCRVPQAEETRSDEAEPTQDEATAPANDAGAFQYGLNQNIVEGVWGRWSAWQPCSVTCSSGFSDRRRECSAPSGQPDENVQCEGDRVEHRPCGSQTPCPVHGQWGKWTAWTECSATCGDTTARFRDCDSPSPQFGGNICPGEGREVEWCNGRRNCPIHGGWKSWSAWSRCSASCGKNGKERRFRTCTEPAPKHGGFDCVGDTTGTRTCQSNAKRCPVDGGWSEWGSWRCSPECANGGEGWAVRSRQCSDPKPLYGGRYCGGNLADTRPCSQAACTVDGVWSMWGSWGDCSSPCGDASFRSRLRRCDNPPPKEGGMTCPGQVLQKQDCDVDPCPDDSVVESPLCDDEDSPGEGGSGCQSAEGSGENSDSSISSVPLGSLDYGD